MKNQKVKTVQFAVGIDLLGSKLTLTSSKNNELELTAVGVCAYSKASNRTVLIPFPNIKGIEFYPEEKEAK